MRTDYDFIPPLPTATNRIALPGDDLSGLAQEWKLAPSGLIVPQSYQRRPTCIGLFSGAGGFELGFLQAGFEVLCGLDFAPDVYHTFAVNLMSYPHQVHYASAEDKARLEKYFEKYLKKLEHEAKAKNGIVKMDMPGSGWIAHNPGVPPIRHYFFGDVRKFTGKQILDALGLKRGDVDVVTGGPPCQGFSSMGKQDVMDPRNMLVFEFGRLILEIQPKTFVMENVPGIVRMRTPDGDLVLDALCAMLERGGYGDAKHLKEGLLATAGLKPGAARRGKKVVDEDEDEEANENAAPRAKAQPKKKLEQIAAHEQIALPM